MFQEEYLVILLMAKNFKIPSMCIPHGTLSKNFDEYDIIYKKTIS